MNVRWFELATGGLLPLVAAMWLVVLAPCAVAATAGELLEKAIYTEETVGNVDEAMKLYEQVIAEGKTGQHAAAQAQYRLALCYLKKNQESAATAAFQALIDNYPDETELVAKAKEHVPSALKLLAVPWTDGERLQLNMKLPTGLDIGTMIYMINAEKHDGKDIWRCSSRGLVTVNDALSHSMVLCDKETFAPIESLWKHSMLGEAKAVYKDNEVVITVVGKDKPFDIKYTPPVFDNEQCVQLFRRLPLEVGYETTLDIVTSLGGNKIALKIKVNEKETLTVPAGTYECYKLELAMLGQTFWVSTDEHRYVVQFSAGGVVAQLAKIDSSKPGEKQTIRNESFSLTLPAGWTTYEPKKPTNEEESEIILLDPHADVRAQIEVRPKGTLKENQRESPKAWTESVIDNFKKYTQDFHIRQPGISDRKGGGMQAATMIGDFTKDGKKMAAYSVAVFGDKFAGTLQLTAETDNFEKSRDDFDKIVESFELK